ncbi:MAG: CHASE3 domain-containing protein [Actinomycetota bacterium]|nr:CHASE3 domain-containing protein [Actinomycetota bacterium]
MKNRLKAAKARLSFSAIFIIAGIFLSLTAIVNAFAIYGAIANEVNTSDISNGIFHPAETSIGNLLIGYLNQETGLRGYVLTGDTSFLAPFVSGSGQVESAYKVLSSSLANYPKLSTLLREVQVAGSSWEISASLHESVPSLEQGALPSAIQSSLQADQASFDALNSKITNLNIQILKTDDALRRDATSALVRLKNTVAIAAIASLLVIATLGTLFFRFIVQPIRRLRDGANLVAGGSLSTPVTVKGARETESLSASIEAMRQGILRESDIERKTALLNSQFRERREVAEAIHDNPLQLLAAAKLRLQIARGETHLDPIDPVVALIDKSTDWMRNMIATLYPPGLARMDFEQAVREHIASIELGVESQIHANVELDELVDRDSHSESTLLLGFRCVQELASNALKGANGGLILLNVKASRLEMLVESINPIEDEDFKEVSKIANSLKSSSIRRHSNAGHLGIPLLVDSVESIGGQFTIRNIDLRGERIKERAMFKSEAPWSPLYQEDGATTSTKWESTPKEIARMLTSLNASDGHYIFFSATVPLLGDANKGSRPILSN